MYFQQQQPKKSQNQVSANEVKQTLMEMFGELGEEIITIILKQNKYQLEPTLEALLKISDQKGGPQNMYNQDEEDDTIFDFKKKIEQNKNQHAQINQLKGEDDGIQVDLEEDEGYENENNKDEYGDQAYTKNQQKNQQQSYNNNNDYFSNDQDRKTVQQIQEEEDMKMAYALQQKYMQQENQYKQQIYSQQQKQKKQYKQNNNNNQQYYQNQYPNYNQNNNNNDNDNQQNNDLQEQDQDMLPEGFQYQNNYQDLIKPKKSVKQKLSDAKKKFMRLFNKKKKNQSSSNQDNKNNQQQQMQQMDQHDGGHDDEFVGQLIDFEDEDENLHKKK